MRKIFPSRQLVLDSCWRIMNRLENLTGKKFGKLMVIKFEGLDKNRNSLYRCLCECGKEMVTRGTCLKRGTTKSCGCLRKEVLIENINKFGGRGKLSNALRNTLLLTRMDDIELAFNILKARAMKRKKDFSLTLDESKILFKSHCFYCGSEKGSVYYNNGTRVISYMGVDRINSLEGYSNENCVACCSICNTAKNTMSQTEFLLWIDKIYNYQHFNGVFQS
jgi:hypothetical protein